MCVGKDSYFCRLYDYVSSKECLIWVVEEMEETEGKLCKGALWVHCTICKRLYVGAERNVWQAMRQQELQRRQSRSGVAFSWRWRRKWFFFFISKVFSIFFPPSLYCLSMSHLSVVLIIVSSSLFRPLYGPAFFMCWSFYFPPHFCTLSPITHTHFSAVALKSL